VERIFDQLQLCGEVQQLGQAVDEQQNQSAGDPQEQQAEILRLVIALYSVHGPTLDQSLQAMVQRLTGGKLDGCALFGVFRAGTVIVPTHSHRETGIQKKSESGLGVLARLD
jgi:hypothetical protein